MSGGLTNRNISIKFGGISSILGNFPMNNDYFFKLCDHTGRIGKYQNFRALDCGKKKAGEFFVAKAELKFSSNSVSQHLNFNSARLAYFQIICKS